MEKTEKGGPLDFGASAGRSSQNLLNQDNNFDPDKPFGMMDDKSYNYCYKNLLMETKEWWQQLKKFQDFMTGPAPSP